jgi:hypothetical protein
MSFLAIKRVTALPGTPDPSTMYIVRSAAAGLVDIYFTSNDGLDVRHVISKAEIQSLINQSVVNATGSLTDVKIVADMAARNSLSLAANGLAMVLDATADATVNAGAALYLYNVTDFTWTKVSEYESLDVQLLWSSIQGKPTATPAQLDDAVTKAHEHTNKSNLDKISEDGTGNLLYNGSPPLAPLTTADW